MIVRKKSLLLLVFLSLFSTSVFAALEDGFDDFGDFDDSEYSAVDSNSEGASDSEGEDENSFLFFHVGSSGFTYSGTDESKFDTYSVAVGMTENFASNLNVGFSVFLHKPIKDKVLDVDSSYLTYSNYAIMLNGFYSIPMDMEFVPYVSAGLGMSQVSIDLVKEVNKSKSQTFKNKGFAYELGAGVFYKFSPKVSFDLNAKYTGFGSVDLSKIDLDSYKISAITIGGGVRVNF